MCLRSAGSRASVAFLLAGLLGGFGVLPSLTQAQEAKPHATPSSAAASVPIPSGVHYQADLTYRVVDETELKLDLARPVSGNRSSRPMISAVGPIAATWPSDNTTSVVASHATSGIEWLT